MKEKRELYRRKMEKTIYTDIIAELEEAIVLSNSGKEKESNDAVNAIKETLEKRIYEIEKMKDGAYLINCARGKVVDEIELLNALNTGKIAGAGIDVFEEEPTKNNELINHPNVSVTPHIGAATKEAQNRIGEEVVTTIANYFEQEVSSIAAKTIESV